MKKLLPLVLLCTLSACSTYAPGEDALGVKLQSEGEEVLQAMRNYLDNESRVPRSIQALVPKYLKAIPPEPKIYYDTQTSTLSFQYTQTGPNGMTVLCHALVGQTQWVCA